MGRNRHISRHRQKRAVLVTRSAGGPSAPEYSREYSRAAADALEITRAILPCEIRIVDEEKREIELCATSEAVDTYGTVFGYDASKDAFTRWIGNVREMHALKAVGIRVALRCDDAARKIFVRLRISVSLQLWPIWVPTIGFRATQSRI